MNRPSLLLVHGYPFDATLWDPVRSYLDPEIQVLAPNLRGFAGRPTGEGAPSLESMADDLANLLREQKVQRTAVVGMSMGGYVALAFAERRRDLLAGLGLISSQAAADSEEARLARRSLIQTIRQQGPGAAAQAAIPKLFAPANSARPDLVRFPVEGAEGAGAEGLAWALEAMARRPDRTKVLEATHVPVLIVHGTEDKFIPVERARLLAKVPADCRYVELAGAGHATPLEAPELLAEALNGLLAKSFASGPSA